MFTFKVLIVKGDVKELQDHLNDNWKIDRVDVVGDTAVYVLSKEVIDGIREIA